MFKNEVEITEWLKTRNVQKIINNYAEKFKNKRIILYGAGLLAKIIFENYDLSSLNIVAVADNKSDNTDFFYDIKKCSPDKIEAFEPDAIIVCTYNEAQIKDFFRQNFPNVSKINSYPIIQRTLHDKIDFFLECFFR